MIKALIKLRIFTFSFKGGTLQLLYVIAELPVSKFYSTGATKKQNKGDLHTSTELHEMASK